MYGLDKMRQQSIPQFGLKPGTFGGHDISGICDIKQLLDGNRMEAESHFHLAAVHPALQFLQAPYATNKINALIGSLVFDVQQLFKYQVG
jgi:hypothetical protein